MSKRFPLKGLGTLVLLAVAILLGGCSISATPLPSPPTVTTTPPPTPTIAPSLAATPSPAPTPTLPAGTYPSAEAAAVFRKVEAEMDAIAGVKAPVPVAVAVLSPDEILERARSLAFPRDAAAEETALKAFGFLPPQASLSQVQKALLPSPPPALYDASAKNIFVSSKAHGALLRLGYAEAYANAIAASLSQAPKCSNDDCALAQEATRTGYAAYLTERWFTEHLSADARAEIQSAYASAQQAPPEIPFALARDWDFPQEYGLGFILGISRRGKKALAAALKNPPQSTAQILHPTIYPAEAPQAVEIPSAEALSKAVGTGWHEVERGVLGEWHTYLLLTATQTEEARLLPHGAAPAAAGWQGDAYAVFANNGAHALLVDWRWASKQDTDEFVRAFVRFARGRYGPLSGRECCMLFWEGKGVFGVLRYSGRARRAVWAEAPTREQAEALLRAVNAPHP